MANEPLFFHVRDLKNVEEVERKDGTSVKIKNYKPGGVTFSVRKFDDRNLSIGYSVTAKCDNFCKKVGRRIAFERADHIIKNVHKNAKRRVHTDNIEALPHEVRRNMEAVAKRSMELLKLNSESVNIVTWADGRARGDLVQLTIRK